MAIPDDLRELLPRHTAAPVDNRPSYFIWVWDEDEEKLYIDHNEDKHPAWKHTWQSLHQGEHLVKGRAFPITGGWRISIRGGGEVDPFLRKHILRAISERI